MSLVRSQSQDVERPGDYAVSSSRLPRPIQKQIEVAHGRGLIATARVNAAAFTARTAVVQVALLSHEEEQLIQMAPLAEGRMKHIVDNFALLAAHEVQSLGR